jgi:anti-sigma B factor antagonist
MSLDVSIKHISADTAVVTLTGALSLGTQLKIADTQIQNLVAGGVTKLVLDLTAVPYSDSAGLGTLIHVYGLLQERQGSIRLCGVSNRVASLLRMTKTDVLLPADPSVEDSLSAIQ